MVERQKVVIDQTVNVQNSRASNTPPAATVLQKIANLANDERQLAQTARDHSEVLHGLGAVRISLEDAERRLLAAATRLDAHDTGPDTQQAERHALDRLERIMETFMQAVDEARQNQPPPEAGAGANAQKPQRRPTFELLEVKMLRMLQVDLQARTLEYQQRIAALKTPPDQAEKARLEKEAQELAAEQGRLAELVEDMLTRDNGNAEPQ
jgi:hypothetical protein